jgi:hypothetical protein
MAGAADVAAGEGPVESYRESMLGGGNQKEFKQLSTLKDVNEISDSYSIGTERPKDLL